MCLNKEDFFSNLKKKNKALLASARILIFNLFNKWTVLIKYLYCELYFVKALID